MKATLIRFSFELGVGLILLILTLLFLGVKLPGNYFDFGKSEYKMVTGVLLLVFIIDQWQISRLKLAKATFDRVKKEITAHKAFGLSGPLFFLLHAQKFGHGSIMALSLVFIFVFAGGILHEKVTQKKNPQLIKLSLIAHIGFSIIMVGLIIFHVVTLAEFGLVTKSGHM
jgi:hypothetical protein